MYASINAEILNSLQHICGSENVFTDEEQLLNYSHDETEDLKFLRDPISTGDFLEFIEREDLWIYEYQLLIPEYSARTDYRSSRNMLLTFNF